MSHIVNLLPAAPEIARALGLIEQMISVSHNSDFPDEANMRLRATHCPVHQTGLTSAKVDE